MSAPRNDRAPCPICGRDKARRELLHADVAHGPVADLVHKEHPEWTGDQTICLACLNRYRIQYVEDALQEQRGELSALDAEVIKSLQEHDVVSRDVGRQYTAGLTRGERLADAVAAFGGSWRFILIFAGVLLAWIVVNSLALTRHPFDPYPYILLNLVLSCLAAIQAPIIMMSQNRQEAKDRLRAEHDYLVNLKAELEVRQLHWKLDQLLQHQWQRLLEIQKIQTELMEELVGRGRAAPPPAKPSS
jgi:uncharacterized membrane protein